MSHLCPKCGKVFDGRLAMLNHFNACKDDEMYKCDECNLGDV